MCDVFLPPKKSPEYSSNFLMNNKFALIYSNMQPNYWFFYFTFLDNLYRFFIISFNKALKHMTIKTMSSIGVKVA